MSLRYCFEQEHVKVTLARSKPSDLAVIASDGVLLARQCYVHEQEVEEEPTE